MSQLPAVPSVDHADVAGLDVTDWVERLKFAAHTPEQQGRRYPGFPERVLQENSVGSAGDHAIDEASHFYRLVLAARSRRRRPNERYLDFGCGWGRIGRFFLREFERGDMVGVDVDPTMLSACHAAEAPGAFIQIWNGRPLPFASGAFDLVTAYSVFSHLPEPIFRFWLSELLRVTRRGGLIVFTVEPERFLDFVGAIDREAPPSGWHAALAEHLGDPAERRRELAANGVTFLATGGGGEHRPVAVYGDVIVTPQFIARAAGVHGRLIDYVDDPVRFCQAVAVIRRTPRAWRGERPPT